MIPAPVYCRLCNTFTGKHGMNDDGSIMDGEHSDRDDCIEVLRDRIERLEHLVTPLDTYNGDSA